MRLKALSQIPRAGGARDGDGGYLKNQNKQTKHRPDLIKAKNQLTKHKKYPPFSSLPRDQSCWNDLTMN